MTRASQRESQNPEVVDVVTPISKKIAKKTHVAPEKMGGAQAPAKRPRVDEEVPHFTLDIDMGDDKETEQTEHAEQGNQKEKDDEGDTVSNVSNTDVTEDTNDEKKGKKRHRRTTVELIRTDLEVALQAVLAGDIEKTKKMIIKVLNNSKLNILKISSPRKLTLYNKFVSEFMRSAPNNVSQPERMKMCAAAWQKEKK